MRKPIAALLMFILLSVLLTGCVFMDNTAPETSEAVVSETDTAVSAADAGEETAVSDSDARSSIPVSAADVEETSNSDTPVEEAVILSPEEFFSDTAFIGDSITVGMRDYCMKNGLLTEALFLCRSNYSVNNAGREHMHLIYKGNTYPIEEAISLSEVNKVFIMLGVNDFTSWGMEEALVQWDVVLTRVIESNPDVEFFIQSMTPVHVYNQKFSNDDVNEYNRQLQLIAEKYGCHYLDVASVLKDDDGTLKNEYCADHYVHLSPEGCAVWVDELYKYAEEFQREQ